MILILLSLIVFVTLFGVGRFGRLNVVVHLTPDFYSPPCCFNWRVQQGTSPLAPRRIQKVVFIHILLFIKSHKRLSLSLLTNRHVVQQALLRLVLSWLVPVLGLPALVLCSLPVGKAELLVALMLVLGKVLLLRPLVVPEADAVRFAKVAVLAKVFLMPSGRSELVMLLVLLAEVLLLARVLLLFARGRAGLVRPTHLALLVCTLAAGPFLAAPSPELLLPVPLLLLVLPILVLRLYLGGKGMVWHGRQRCLDNVCQACRRKRPRARCHR